MTEGLKHHWHVLSTAWRHRKELATENRRRGGELEFLPAALEVQETPPSPIGRTIALVICGFFTVAVVWAFVGEMDIIAVAHGKIIPSGKSKVVQPLEIGVVQAIHVEEGQEVLRGDPLVDLDTTATRADQDRLGNELMSARIALSRTEALLAALAEGRENASEFFTAPVDAPPGIVQVQRSLMENEYREYLANRRSLGAEIRQKRAEQGGIKENLKKLDTIIPLVAKRTESLRRLASKGLSAENEYLELEQERVEHVQDRAVLRNRLEETNEAVQQAEARLDALRAEFRKTILAEKTETELRVGSLEQDLIKATTRTGLQRLQAPVDGVVQQLAVHTVGGVVTPAQALMVIVPREKPLEVEAFVQNKDIGFVREGQEAEIKVDAFPFTSYGTIDAEVLKLSNDAIEDQKLGWVFGARVSMAKSALWVEGKEVNLSPGMSVAVEVKTGKRKVIEYFLSPLMRGLDESVRER